MDSIYGKLHGSCDIVDMRMDGSNTVAQLRGVHDGDYETWTS